MLEVLILTLGECPIRMLGGMNSWITVHIHTDGDNYDDSIQPCFHFLPLLYKKNNQNLKLLLWMMPRELLPSSCC